MIEQKIESLLTRLENTNNQLMEELDKVPDGDLDPLIEERDKIGHELIELSKTPENRKHLLNLSPSLQNISARIVELDKVLLSKIELINQRLATHQQQLIWKTQRQYFTR